MDKKDSPLTLLQKAYAKKIAQLIGVQDNKIIQAFASIPREKFVGDGPWILLNEQGEEITPDANPAHLYTNKLVIIDKKKAINNGEPALHMPLMAKLAVTPGDHVVHVGAGTGYYTSILKHLAGEKGRVTAIEVDPVIARCLRSNCSDNPSIEVICGNGIEVSFDEADAIYVNAGATYIHPRWLDQLKPNGRLIIPLTTYPPGAGLSRLWAYWFRLYSWGVVFLIQKIEGGFKSEFVSPIGIYPCMGMRNRKAAKLLAKSLDKGDPQKVKSLRTIDHPRDSQCWCHGPENCLSYLNLE
jgi:protein-L-isoaspartate(D-aspartate) O-methyltransferase